MLLSRNACRFCSRGYKPYKRMPFMAKRSFRKIISIGDLRYYIIFT
ncbi:MAG: hypothetical protein ACYCTB_00130 [bacterium]